MPWSWHVHVCRRLHHFVLSQYHYLSYSPKKLSPNQEGTLQEPTKQISSVAISISSVAISFYMNTCCYWDGELFHVHTPMLFDMSLSTLWHAWVHSIRVFSSQEGKQFLVHLVCGSAVCSLNEFEDLFLQDILCLVEF